MSIDFVILAAGAGSRMQTKVPKIFHTIAGKPIIRFVLDSCKNTSNSNTIVVTTEQFAKHEIFSDVKVAVQTNQKGTAAAVISAIPLLSAEFVIVLCGDMPFVSKHHIEILQNDKSDISFLAMNIPENLITMPYGRVVLNQSISEIFEFEKIVEYSDAKAEEKKITLCNSGIYKIKTEILKKYIFAIKPNNQNKELYLTEILNIAKNNKHHVSVQHCDEYWPFHGINTLSDLEKAEYFFQNQLREKFMQNGVQLLSPETTFFSFDSEIASNVLIEPDVVIKTNVKISSDVIVKSFSYLENCVIKDGAKIGPFARIRGGSVLSSQTEIGNFVEIKNSFVDKETKIKHLSYVGDAKIGISSNIGAGTITCNFDGMKKHQTTIGKNVFVGSNCALIAPVSVGDGAFIGAGSVITKNIPENGLAVSRPKLEIKTNWASKFFNRKKTER